MSTLTEQTKRVNEKRREQARATLHELARRADQPRAGDAERLADAAATLGLADAEIEEIVALVPAVDDAEKRAAELPAIVEQEAKQRADMRAVDAWELEAAGKVKTEAEQRRAAVAAEYREMTGRAATIRAETRQLSLNRDRLNELLRGSRP